MSKSAKWCVAVKKTFLLKIISNLNTKKLTIAVKIEGVVEILFFDKMPSFKKRRFL